MTDKFWEIKNISSIGDKNNNWTKVDDLLDDRNSDLKLTKKESRFL